MTSYYKDDKGVIYTELFICPECGCKNDKIKGYGQYDFSLDSITELNAKDDFTIDLSDKFLIPSIGWEIQNKDQGFVSYGYTSSLILKIKGISCKKKN